MIHIALMIGVGLSIAVGLLLYVTWILAYDRGWNNRGRMHVSDRTLRNIREGKL